MHRVHSTSSWGPAGPTDPAGQGETIAAAGSEPVATRRGRGAALARVGALCVLLLAAPAGADEGAAAGPDVQRGLQVYDQLCASCHGRYGRGDGPLAETLRVPLPDFTDPKVLGSRTDEQLMTSLRGGGSPQHAPMAIGVVLDDATLRDTLAALRTLYVPGRHASPRAGEDIYQSACFACHGRKGDGNGPAAAKLPADHKHPRNFLDPEFKIAGREAEVARVIKLGPAAAFHGSTWMPSWASQLSDQQIQDVVEYLKELKEAARP